MNLKVNLKLKFSNVRKVIKVKYNTFEKATFDEYLVCSALLHSKTKTSFNKYIDELTGNGSLNAHFKKLYDYFCNFSKDELLRIMSNSMIPTLKIDESSWYNYYPELDISVFKNRVFDGDMEDKIDAKAMLHIQEEIVEQTVLETSCVQRAEPYVVSFDGTNKMSVKFFDKDLSIDAELFSSVLELPFSGIFDYMGKVHDSCEGNGWSVVTDALLNNMHNVSNVSYINEDGDHCLIKNDGVKVTRISKIYGLHIYKETTSSYINNPKLCESALEVLLRNLALSQLKKSAMDVILQHVSNKKIVQDAINNALTNQMDEVWAKRGLNLIRSGIVQGWSISAQKAFLKYVDESSMNALYQAAPDLEYKIEQLLAVDKTLLSKQHLQIVEKYLGDLEKMRDTIKHVIGEVTTSGLRERMKVLKSDEETKRFSKLCNELIGHVKKDLQKATFAEVEQWHTKALELSSLGNIIAKKIADEEKK